jgi:hypothetical protein
MKKMVREKESTMKKICLTIALAGILSTPSLFAAMSVTLYQDAYSYGNGGEFRAVGNADLNSAVNWTAYKPGTTANQGSSFQTFCIEYNEEFSPGVTYSASISGSALPRGVPVTMGTAWLYSQFASGTLAGYNYGAGRSTSAGSLQQAIWWFQGENNGVENAWAFAAENALAGMGLNYRDAANGQWGVEALNLGLPSRVQDQLVITRQGSTDLVPVPEPTTMVAGIGALGLLLFGAGVHSKRSVLRLGK